MQSTFRRKSVFVLALVISAMQFASAEVAPAGRAAKSWSVRWRPTRLVNGSAVLFEVVAPRSLESLSAKWLDQHVFFYFNSQSKTWYGIAGVSLETPPTKYSLKLEGKTASGEDISFQRKIALGKAKYRRIAVSVPKQFTAPSPEQLQEIHQEQALKQQTFARVEPEREWSGRFVPPVKASISDVFGTSRVFNGKVQSVHQGLDYAVPAGTPVQALNSGTVILARLLFFEGGCVVLDHGQGLLTIYMHLSKLGVKEGERVAKGHEIGLSGGTGRATGPHLHVAVRWQGIYLNPATLLNLTLP